MKSVTQFKIRASAIGKIMGVKGLGKTGQTYCQTWLKEQVYGRRNEFTSKYTDKGITVEDNSIDLVADHFGYGLLLKNEEHFSNDFITGTPDVLVGGVVIDVKNSWDCFTFPLFEESVPNKDYYWQMQGYMSITGKESAKLIYTLMDTPDHLIEKEFKYNNPNEIDYEEFSKKFKYEEIKAERRIKLFEVEKNDKDIALIESRVEECREYINGLL